MGPTTLATTPSRYLTYTSVIVIQNGVLLDRIVTGSQYLTEQGIAHDTAWDLWQNIMALGIIAVGLLFIAYIQLRRIKKLK